MIWSPDAIDYTKGVIFAEDGTIKPKKIGCYVMTIEEARKALQR